MLRTPLTLFAVLSAVPAAAQEFSGPHIDAVAGWSQGDRGAGIAEQQRGDGLVYGAGAGYDFRIGNAVLGVIGEISDVTGSSCGQIDLPIRGPGLPAAKGRYCGKEGRALSGGVRAGYVVGDRTLLYVSGSYANMRRKVTFDGVLDGKDTKTSNGRNLDGVRLGAGMEYAIAKRTSLKAEYRYTAFGYDLRSDQHQLVTGLAFHF